MQKRIFLLLAILGFFGGSMLAQSKFKCGSSHKGLPLEQQSALLTPPNSCNFLTKARKEFQISAHVAKDSLGGIATGIAAIETALADLNEVFAPVEMSFSICYYNIMDDFHYFEWFELDDEPYADIFDYIPNTINMYFVGSVETTAEGLVGGYAAFPGGTDRIVIGCDAGEVPSITVIHEMGHFFGLFHTFEEDNGIGLADGSNCESAGDLLCDTDADPEGTTNDDCEYTGPFVDPEGNFYTPPLDNYMSYYDGCRCRFTKQQYNRMVEQYLNLRFYLW